MSQSETPDLLDRVGAGRLLGLKHASVERLVLEGRLIPRAKRGRSRLYDAAEVEALARALAAERLERASSPASDLKIERAALLRVQRMTAEDALRIRRGELVEAAVVEADTKVFLVILREAIMGVAPILVQAGLVAARDEQAVADVLRDALVTTARKSKEHVDAHE